MISNNMSNQDYNDRSVDAVVSRIETKLDTVLRQQEDLATSNRKLWAAMGRIDTRVAVIAVTVSGLLFLAKTFIFR
jgi:hypothetical protein